MIPIKFRFELWYLLKLVGILVFSVQVTGCATPLSRSNGLSKNDSTASIDITYQETGDKPITRRDFRFELNSITDLRGKEGYQSTFLGQGRNGMGLVYVKFHAREPVEKIVRQMFEKAQSKDTSEAPAQALKVDIEIENFEYNEFPVAVPIFYSKLSVIIHSPNPEREPSKKVYAFERDKKSHAKRYLGCWKMAKGDGLFHDAFQAIEKRVSCVVSSAASEFIDEILLAAADQKSH